MGITVNKNTIPFETKSPFVTSGIRLGTAALTTRGFTEKDMDEIAAIIDKILDRNVTDYTEIKARIKSLTDKFPLYPEILNGD